MMDRYTTQEAIAAVPRLNDLRLVSYMEAEIVTPMQTPDGPVFRQIDIVRMEFLCELSESFDLDPDALAVIVSLVDQLHGTRAELRAVLDAIASEPQELRDRIAAATLKGRTPPATDG